MEKKLKRILLVCSAGMSTSMLVKKMKDYCAMADLEYEIEAKGMAQAKPEIKEWDLIMVGPQVAFVVDELRKLTDKKVELIPSKIYALGKGKEAIELAKKLLDE